jgi:DeoR/GlpR family transcriptional regulator of sugar metabolism
MKILRTLREHGRCSLSMLAAATGLSRSAIQKDFEQHLMKLGLMTIDGLRGITVKGCKLIDTVPNHQI